MIFFLSVRDSYSKMNPSTKKLGIKSQKQFEIIDITARVKEVLSTSGLKSGIINVFAPHTTAAIRINHNEPLLMQDLMKMLYRLVPVDMNYSHDLFEIRSGVEAGERSNGHAHVKAFLLGASESIPFENGEMLLGPRQSVFFVELDGGRDRTVFVSVSGK